MPLVNRVVQDGLARQSADGDNDKFTRSLSNTSALDSNQVISALAIVGGLYLRSGMTAGRTDTTDTGANIDIAAPSAGVGDKFTMMVSNQVAFALTIAGGTGVTVTSTKTSIPASGSGTVVFQKTGVATYNAYIL